MKEKWKWIRGYKHYYKVSNFGRVKGVRRFVGGKCGSIRVKHPRKLKLSVDANGYLFVGLSKHAKVKYCRVHRLVLEAFIGPCPYGREGCHKDDDRTNNNVRNLYWGTDGQNCKDAIRNGKRNKPCLGESNPASKLTLREVALIRRLYKKGNISMKMLATRFGLKSPQTICLIVHGRTWKEVA